MSYDSTRDWIQALEKAGELIRITEPVATELEITEIADRQMKSPGGGKALLFEKPTIQSSKFEVRSSKFPVLINSMGSVRRMAMALGVQSVDAAAAEIGALMKAAHRLSRGRQAARHRPRPSPRQTQAGEDRAVQGSYSEI